MSRSSLPSRLLRVFLCHSSDDKPTVRVLYESLKSNGFGPWLDEENLLAGQDWNYEIPKAVRSSDVVVVCLSSSSGTKTGYVQKEIKIALDVVDEQPEGTIFIIPAKLEECDIPDRLKRWHWVNLYDENGYGRLIKSLQGRAEGLGLIVNSLPEEDDNADSLYDEDEMLDGGTHMTFPCDLDEGEKIKIDLKSSEPVDVLIMDEGDYQEWHDKGEVNLLYKEYLEREQLHTLFTAPDTGKYIVVVRNELDDEAKIQLTIEPTE
ncbi:MAG: toll/interleukin-1 receptor domain-containing protein [Pyrinomonadaceae bacterium]